MVYSLGSSDIGVWLYDMDNASSIALMEQYTKIFPPCDANIAMTSHKQRMRHFSYIMRRWLLSHITGIPIGRLRFYTTPQGKPILYDSPVKFSISHSGNHWGIAITRNAPVGLDIEMVRARKNEAEIVKSYFLPLEQKAYAEAKNDQERRALFYRFWTTKEAWAKFHGVSVFNVLSGHIHQEDPASISCHFLHSGTNLLAMNIACQSPDASVVYFENNSLTPNGLSHRA